MTNPSPDPLAARPSPATAEAVTRPGKRHGTTSFDPQEVMTWLRRAETAKTLPEVLAYLSQALFFNPRHPLARRKMYQSLQRLLQKDAFLTYVDETEGLYRVQTATGQPLVVSKERAVSPPYPPKEISLLQRAYHWLGWALLGLLPAGLGTLICAPIAVVLALLAWLQPLSPADSTRFKIVLLGATLLWCGALPFYILLVLHLL